jgi:hypothetical protein
MTGANRFTGHTGCAGPSLSSPCAKLRPVDSKPRVGPPMDAGAA